MAVPEGWIDLELDPAIRNAEIDRLVDERLEDLPELSDLRAELVAMLRSTAARTRDAGGVLALLYCDITDEEPYVVAASLVVTMHLAEGRMTAERIEAELGAADGAELRRSETGAGPAVCITGHIRDVYPGDDTEIELYSSRYFVPHADGSVLVVASFSTLNLDMAEDFQELFDAMVETLELTEAEAGPAAGLAS